MCCFQIAEVDHAPSRVDRSCSRAGALQCTHPRPSRFDARGVGIGKSRVLAERLGRHGQDDVTVMAGWAPAPRAAGLLSLAFIQRVAQ